MGPEFDDRVSYGEGNKWERRDSWLINLDIVGATESTFFSLDCFIRFGGAPREDLANRMRTLCSAAAGEADDWGFKDPLTALTYPQWSTVLPRHRVIAVYRDPGQVMRHYRCRSWDAHRAWRVLRAWTHYNEGIANALSQAGSDGLALRYEALMDGDAEFDRLQRFVDRDLVDVRDDSSYRGRTQHPLRNPIGSLLGAATSTNPNRTLACLEALRLNTR